METARQLYARLASGTAPWQASDRRKFVAAAKAVAEGKTGPELPTKAQLREVAEIYFSMATEDFDAKWATYVKQKFAAAVFGSADPADRREPARPGADGQSRGVTQVLSAWDDPHRVGSFQSALLRIRKQPQWLGSRRARIRAVQQELHDAKQWTPEQGVILEPALRTTLTQLAPLRGALPPTASAVEIFGYYIRELEDFLATTSRPGAAQDGRRVHYSSGSGESDDDGSDSDERSHRRKSSARSRRARLKQVRAAMKVRLKLTPYEIDVRTKFLEAHEVFVTDAKVNVPADVLLHIQEEFAPKRIRFKDVYKHNKGESHKIRVRQVYAMAAQIYREQINRSMAIRARELNSAPADPLSDVQMVRAEEKLRSQLRVKITLLMGESDVWSTFHEELRSEVDLGALELAHPHTSAKVLKRIRKSMMSSIQCRRARTRKRGRDGRNKQDRRTGRPDKPRCHWCNGVGHGWRRCPDKDKKKFHPKSKFASWRGDLPAGVKEP